MTSLDNTSRTYRIVNQQSGLSPGRLRRLQPRAVFWGFQSGPPPSGEPGQSIACPSADLLVLVCHCGLSPSVPVDLELINSSPRSPEPIWTTRGRMRAIPDGCPSAPRRDRQRKGKFRRGPATDLRFVSPEPQTSATPRHDHQDKSDRPSQPIRCRRKEQNPV